MAGAVFFGDALIVTWVREAYSESHTILIVLLFSQVVSSPLGIVKSIIFGVQAKNKIRQDPSLQGEGMAQAGFILGIISLVLYGGLFIVAIILAASNNDSSSTSLGAVVHLLAV